MIAPTKHARERGRERFVLKASSVERMAVIALGKGLFAGDTAGRLRSYLDRKVAGHPCTTLRIYGEVVFVFGERNVLVTFWPLPHEFKKTVAKIREAKKAA